MNTVAPTTRMALVTGTIAALIFATACGGSTALSGQASMTAAPATASVSSPATAAPSAAATTSTAAKVSANNASNTELIAALTAAGVPSPANWAREVQEYRPYDASDANMTKLRQNLAKYNPAAGVVDKIISALSLP